MTKLHDLTVLHNLVFWIRDILVWIRIHGSITLTNGSESSSGSCSFRRWHSRRQQKIISNILKVHWHHSSKILKVIKKSQKSNGSGMPKYLRFRVRNTGIMYTYSSCRVRSLHLKPVPADQYYWITDPYPDPARFFSVFIIPTKIFYPGFFAYYFLTGSCDGCNLNSKPRLLLNWWSRTV